MAAPSLEAAVNNMYLNTEIVCWSEVAMQYNGGST